MIAVGVIGLGMMGTTHLGIYAERHDARIVAVSDIDQDRLYGKSSVNVNIDGLPGEQALPDDIAKYRVAEDLITDSNVQMVDICLPTLMHGEFVKMALKEGKHVLVEKPLARTSAEAFELADTADAASRFAMPAMCMRFWPGWDWMKEAIKDHRYGRVLSAHFRRLISHPGSAFCSDGKACGGALLDLHVHDVDFIQYCFGMPEAVFSRGYSKISGEIDHVITQYMYSNIPLVTAEGGWAMADGYGLDMQYTVNFEHATARFIFDATNNLTLFQKGNSPRSIDLSSDMGYVREIAYFLDCISSNRAPSIVNFRDAAYALVIVEAERESILSEQIVEVEKIN